MKMTTRLTLGALLLLVAAAAGCVPEIERPDVRLAGVRLGGLGLEGGLLYVRLGVINPNDFELDAAGLTYDLELSDPGTDGDDWVRVARGEFTEDIRVEANDSTVVEIPVEFRYSGLGGALRSIVQTGTVDYRVRGIVQLRSPIPTEVPYRHSGTVAVLDSR